MAMNMGSFASRVVATRVVALDGTGDFTTIQEAINDLPAGGGVVYVKEGTYTITTAISIPIDNITIRGAGRSSIIASSGRHDGLTCAAKKGLYLDGLYFHGDNTAPLTDSDGLYITGASDGAYITNCWFDEWKGHGIYISSTASDVMIDTCLSDSNFYNGINLSGVTGRVIVRNCICKDNGTSGTDGSGIGIGTGSDVIVIGNICYNNYNCGITTSVDTERCIFKGNICNNNNNQDGIFIAWTFLSNAINHIISGNICDSNGRYGINVTGDGHVVLGNRCNDNTTGELNVTSTNTETAHNNIT